MANVYHNWQLEQKLADNAAFIYCSTLSWMAILAVANQTELACQLSKEAHNHFLSQFPKAMHVYLDSTYELVFGKYNIHIKNASNNNFSQNYFLARNDEDFAIDELINYLHIILKHVYTSQNKDFESLLTNLKESHELITKSLDINAKAIATGYLMGFLNTILEKRG